MNLDINQVYVPAVVFGSLFVAVTLRSWLEDRYSRGYPSGFFVSSLLVYFGLLIVFVTLGYVAFPAVFITLFLITLLSGWVIVINIAISSKLKNRRRPGGRGPH